MGMVGWKSRGLCWRVRDGYVPGLHYSLEPLFSSDKNEKNCPPSVPPPRISHRIGNCFENRVYQPLLDPHLENHPFLSLLILPSPSFFSSPLLPYPAFESALRDMSTKLGDTSRTSLRIDRVYSVCGCTFPAFLPLFSLFFSPLLFLPYIVFSFIYYSLIYICFSNSWHFFFGIILLTSLLQPFNIHISRTSW